MQTFIRPTNMGLAFVNALVSASVKPGSVANTVVTLVQKDDRPFTRTEHDGLRVSQRTLNALNKGNARV